MGFEARCARTSTTATSAGAYDPAMRAAQVVSTTGPGGVEIREVPEPVPGAADVLIEVHSLGISFPDLLLSKGQYQLRPETPFTLGVDVAGVVVASAGEGFAPGDRVCGVVPYGAAAERAVVPVVSTFPLPDALSFDEGAALPLNYLTAHFALVTRAGLRAGETVLVHGAAGGVGTATLQVAKGLGARTIAVVSTEEKAEVARRAGADDAVLLDGFKDAALALTDGRASTWCSTSSAATSSPTRCACWRRWAGCSWWASPPARASPRSRSTGCCSTTSTSVGSVGAPTRWRGRASWRSSGSTWRR